MAMITGARVVPAVNHVASSTLPTPPVPENKYASIYLLSAGDQEAASKSKAYLPLLLYAFSIINRHFSELLHD